ncbi:rnfH Ubiquitin family protein [Bordetella holmesii 30539]|uniref:UPF0125 protein D559_1500 n=1 Tax=Bordetella holmesii 1058 TaxID=1247648 RepID=A0ABN0RXZ9_9BORD|nr:rnfH Ubiquitin family protein [Bordetella holmesii 30539]EXX94091.1 rnfH Ubiquitin family protein [Bordetella holmesii 1058]
MTVCHAQASGVWMRELTLPAGATVGEALMASGFGQAFPDIDPWQQGLGIYGQRAEAHTRLHPGDRVEIYRALTFDPKESRRRRAEHRRARVSKAGERQRPAGLL